MQSTWDETNHRFCPPLSPPSGSLSGGDYKVVPEADFGDLSPGGVRV